MTENPEQQVKPQSNGGKQDQAKPEFTNLDAENLYASCLDVQRLNFKGLQKEIQLSKLITKLKKWTDPVTEGKKKYAVSLGFIPQGSTYIPQSKFSQEEKEQMVLTLDAENEKVNNEPFEEWNELKKMLPLSLFTEEVFEEKNIQFLEGMNKQYFLQFCIVPKKETEK